MSNRKQRIKVGGSYTDHGKKVVWGSTRINSMAIAIQYYFKNLCHLLEGTNLASYTNDTTPYAVNVSH